MLAQDAYYLFERQISMHLKGEFQVNRLKSKDVLPRNFPRPVANIPARKMPVRQ